MLLHRRHLVPALAAGLLAGLTACPQASEPAPEAPRREDPPNPDDKRIVADTSDFYVAANGVPNPAPEPATRGTGKPDETNGSCRLFAPELQDPECCERQLGFDVEVVKQACGLRLYLGESFHATCGYYFLPDATTTGTPATWFRLSVARGADAREAAESHDRYTRQLSRDPDFRSLPIPGIAGAYWSEQDGLHWAFLPGWSQVRQFTWQAGACSDEGIREILERLVDAPEIPAGTPRTSLVPGRGPAPAAAPNKPSGATKQPA
jgi:hypothetical protein